MLFHLEPEIGLSRSEDDPDRIEAEGEAFHAKVADAFLRIAEEHPERFVIVEASESADAVHKQVREALLRLLRPPEEGVRPADEQGPTAGHEQPSQEEEERS